MNQLLQMLSDSSDDEENEPVTPPDVLAHTLQELCARYVAGNPFKRGDLVTPRPGYGVKGERRPHIVLDVFESTRKIPDDYRGNMAMWPDMRVACENRGDIVAFLGESLAYQPYDGPVAEI